MPTTYKFGRVSDEALLKLAKALIEKLEDSAVTLQFSDEFALSFDKDSSWSEPILSLTTTGSYLIQYMSVRCQGIQFTLTYQRSSIYEIVNGNWAWKASNSPFID